MDAEAIKAIQDGNAEAFQTANGIASPFGLLLTPESWQRFDVEKYMENRRRQRNAFKTEMLDDFVEYIQGHDGVDNPRVFVQPRNMSAVCIFNVGDADTPGHLDDFASLSLDSAEAYIAAQGIHGRTLQQGDFLDWVDDHSEFIVAFFNSNGEPLAHPAALQALRTFNVDKIHSVSATQHDVRRELGDLERIEVREAAGFPTHFTYRFEPAPGLPFVAVDIKIVPHVIADTRANVERRAPAFRIRVRAFDAFKETVGRTLVLELDKRLNAEAAEGTPPVPVLVGTLSPGA